MLTVKEKHQNEENGRVEPRIILKVERKKKKIRIRALKPQIRNVLCFKSSFLNFVLRVQVQPQKQCHVLSISSHWQEAQDC